MTSLYFVYLCEDSVMVNSMCWSDWARGCVKTFLTVSVRGILEEISI